jgi:type II secretory pathway pseudopilin PulG
MPRDSRHAEEGFTLIEAVVAALILLISVAFIAQMYVTAMQQNQTSRRYSHATAIAQSKLEELNAVPITQLQYGGDLGTTDGGGRKGAEGYFEFLMIDSVESDRIGVTERENANYVRYWKIEPDPSPQGWAGIYRITVRVVSLRPAQGNAPEEATLSTVRSQF